MSEWPAWATETVHLQPADPAWAGQGERGVRTLTGLLEPWLAGPVEHVGSTAVPGLLAKPVLDYQAAVRDLADAPGVAAALAPYDWHFVPPELDLRAYRRFFVQTRGGHRAAHLHLLVAGSEPWAAQLAFRDALRADAVLAERYGSLKQQLADLHGDDREAYSDAKEGFVREVLSKMSS